MYVEINKIIEIIQERYLCILWVPSAVPSESVGRSAAIDDALAA
jgi:hypothetical protein